MSPSHTGQLNTSHYGLASLERLITLLTNHQSQSEKLPLKLANPYMGNAGQHPHKWQEIELWERMWSVWALQRHLFIHRWSRGQTDFMGLKIKAKVMPNVILKRGNDLFFVYHWCGGVIRGKYSYRQPGLWLRKLFLKRSSGNWSQNSEFLPIERFPKIRIPDRSHLDMWINMAIT